MPDNQRRPDAMNNKKQGKTVDGRAPAGSGGRPFGNPSAVGGAVRSDNQWGPTHHTSQLKTSSLSK